MQLAGSCHCGKVRFRLESHTPYPYMRCYCSICRKTQGGGGYAINIMGVAATLKVRGIKYVSVYRARLSEGTGRKRASPARRNFCARCGSALWVADPRWPEWVYPFASAIDTPLPKPLEHVALMLNYAAPWVEVPREPESRGPVSGATGDATGANRGTRPTRDQHLAPPYKEAEASGRQHRHYPEYPEETILDWHKKRRLIVD